MTLKSRSCTEWEFSFSSHIREQVTYLTYFVHISIMSSLQITNVISLHRKHFLFQLQTDSSDRLQKSSEILQATQLKSAFTQLVAPLSSDVFNAASPRLFSSAADHNKRWLSYTMYTRYTLQFLTASLIYFLSLTVKLVFLSELHMLLSKNGNNTITNISCSYMPLGACDINLTSGSVHQTILIINVLSILIWIFHVIRKW